MDLLREHGRDIREEMNNTSGDMELSNRLVILAFLLLLMIPFIYVGIMFWNVESYDYENNLVLDISNEGTLVWADPVIWHDDCSSNSTFPYLADAAWFTGAMGTIDSVDGYIYATDYGSASGSHGPLYYQSFNDSIIVGQLDWLEAEIEANGSSNTLGAAAVFLFDENYNRVALLDVADSWTNQNDVAAYAGWYTPEQTSTTTPNTWPVYVASEPYHETLRMSFNSTGVFASIPRIGNFKLIDIEDINLNSTIRYIGVNLRTSSSYATCETLRIHDIRMQYRLPASTEGTSPPDILAPPDLIVLISIGSGGVIFIIIILIIKSKIPSSGGSATGYQW